MRRQDSTAKNPECEKQTGPAASHGKSAGTQSRRDPLSAPSPSGAGLDTVASSTNTADQAAVLFYDGDCGFCHGIVRWVVERDRGSSFRFAPIGGATFDQTVAERLGQPIPDSVVLLLADGRLLIRSDAAIQILTTLGSPWARWGKIMALFPRPLRDLGYRVVAYVRRLLTRRPESSCPLLPPELAARFDP